MKDKRWEEMIEHARNSKKDSFIQFPEQRRTSALNSVFEVVDLVIDGARCFQDINVLLPYEKVWCYGF